MTQYLAVYNQLPLKETHECLTLRLFSDSHHSSSTASYLHFRNDETGIQRGSVDCLVSTQL